MGEVIEGVTMAQAVYHFADAFMWVGIAAAAAWCLRGIC